MPRYTVTELAGPKVAGRRVEHGATIDLSENAARAELLAGVIVPTVEDTSTAPVAEATEATPTEKKQTSKKG